MLEVEAALRVQAHVREALKVGLVQWCSLLFSKFIQPFRFNLREMKFFSTVGPPERRLFLILLSVWTLKWLKIQILFIFVVGALHEHRIFGHILLTLLPGGISRFIFDAAESQLVAFVRRAHRRLIMLRAKYILQVLNCLELVLIGLLVRIQLLRLDNCQRDGCGILTLLLLVGLDFVDCWVE